MYKHGSEESESSERAAGDPDIHMKVIPDLHVRRLDFSIMV